MKQILLTTCLLTLALMMPNSVLADVEISEANFPDAAFRTVLMNLPEGKDGVLTDEEIDQLKGLSVTDINHEITSMKGIEFLTKLGVLQCFGTLALGEIDLTGNHELQHVDIEFSTIKSLNVSGLASLRTLICTSIFLESLNVAECTALKTLWCPGGRLTSIDVSDCKQLESLVCWRNCFTTIDLSANTALKEVVCYHNNISGAGMDALIASLPIKDTMADLFIVDSDDPEEGNICTTAQADLARSKNWKVLDFDYIENGEQSTDMNIIQRFSADSTPYFNLQGRRLTGSPNKGIYIQNGKKVLRR
jgi:Leucine-rich repeat (LRR) protein